MTRKAAPQAARANVAQGPKGLAEGWLGWLSWLSWSWLSGESMRDDAWVSWEGKTVVGWKGGRKETYLQIMI